MYAGTDKLVKKIDELYKVSSGTKAQLIKVNFDNPDKATEGQSATCYLNKAGDIEIIETGLAFESGKVLEEYHFLEKNA